MCHMFLTKDETSEKYCRSPTVQVSLFIFRKQKNLSGQYTSKAKERLPTRAGTQGDYLQGGLVPYVMQSGRE